MGDWEPDETSRVTQDCAQWCTALMWIVPAKVEGSWRLGEQQLRLTQRYQVLSGTLGTRSVTDARLDGKAIRFTVDGVRYSGTVDGETMTGSITGGPGGNWSASRI